MRRDGVLGPRPVVMDGERRFKSLMDCARYLVKTTGVATAPQYVASDISEVLCKGRGTVYGHTFEDDITPMTPKEMEELIERQKRLLIAQHRQMEICALRGKAPTAAMVDRWARMLKDECGVEA